VVHAAEPAADDWAHPIEPIPVEDVRARLAAEVEKVAAKAGVACDLAVGVGAAHRVLDAERRRYSPDLVVVGATARRGGLLGSTAERVARTSPVPVLVVRGELAMPPRRVVAPVDLSMLSGDGFRYGLDIVRRLAEGDEPTIVALFAIGYLDPMFREMRQRRGTVEEMTALAEQRLEQHVEQHRPRAPLVIERKVALGPAREEILGEAKNGRADLVVMATHGHGGYQRMLLGSVAATIVREAPCSVLLVPPSAAFGDAVADAVESQTAPWKLAETP
jgi:nucleotide-binding universal stress UspA family protein